jgi:antitoxin component YwqK of YwqJK toxin-antitoxin module
MKKLILFFTGLLCLGYACKPARSDVMVEIVDKERIKAMEANSDTVFTVEPGSNALALAMGSVSGIQFVQNALKTNTTIWYDASGRVVGMLQYTKNVLTDSVAFHPNGQRMLAFTLNGQGVPQGPARYFYPDGRVRSDGWFAKGIKTGVWREFDETGKLVETHEYDRRGQKIR